MSAGGLIGYGALWAFFAVFLIYPLIRLFYDSFTTEDGVFTLANFQHFFTDSFYLRSLFNSLLAGRRPALSPPRYLGIAIAFLLLRYEFPGRKLFSYLTIIPMIMPPLVGVMGFTFILGRAGTVNVILQDYLASSKPVNFMYGVHGVLLVETLHLFPLMTLSIVDAMSKISPSLDEAAESVGSRGLRKFWDITFPLTTPGYVTGALLVFIWTFADFATPLVVGVDDLLASQAYLNIVQFVDRRLFKMGIVISAIMVVLAIVFLVVAKKYVAIKDYSSLSYTQIERRRLSAGFALRRGRISDAGADLRLHPLLRDRTRFLRPRMGADADPRPLHAAIFPARFGRDAQVHSQQPALFGDFGRHLHCRGSAGRLGDVAHEASGPRGAGLADHPDPGSARYGNRRRLHARLSRSSAVHAVLR